MGREVRMSVTVPVPVAAAFQVWADQERYPEWMEHLERVERTGERTSRWTMRNPTGRQMQWDTEVTVLRPNEKIAWSSLDGDVVTYGVVEFEPMGPRRTRVTVRRFHGTGKGQDAAALAARIGDPAKRLGRDLQSFLHRLRALHGQPATSALAAGRVGGAAIGAGIGRRAAARSLPPSTPAGPPPASPRLGPSRLRRG